MTQDAILHSGMASIVGRPNVGKSTLLNKLVGEKIAIVSNVPQTTRNQVRGIYTDERGQIVFVDTPGLHMPKDKLDRFMQKSAYTTTDETDCVIHLVDVSEPTGEEEEAIVRRLAKLRIPVIMGLNKIDITDKFIPDYIELWERIKGCPVTEFGNFHMIPVSGKAGTNIDELMDILFKHLPEGEPLYPSDVVTDIPQKMAIADIVREKLFGVLRQEIPHAIAVVIESIEQRKKAVYIRVLIFVESDSQKRIVVGKQGGTLKEVGKLARQDLQDLLEAKVFIELFVKAKKNWRDDISLLQEMGYDSI